MKDRKLLTLILIVGVIEILFMGWLGLRSLRTNAFGQRVQASGSKVDELLQYMDLLYVDSIDVDSLTDVAMATIVSELDPHSAFIPAADIEDVNSELGGSFSGIGIQFNIQQDTINVVQVISGGPSEGVGLLAGDRIITVDDSLFVGRTINNEKVLHTLRGEKGTTVRLGVKRSTCDTLLQFTIVRGDIPLHSVDAAFMADKRTGLVRVSKFSENTYKEFITALATLRSEGAERYIVDLRENSGGFMDQTIQMSNEFLDKGRLIVYSEGRAYSRFNSYATGTGRFRQVPLVVLIDEFSASASEIFAGAMQDNDRATIVGRRSFGKGLVQQQFELSDGSAVRLTVARYYTPSGRCIQKPYVMGEGMDYQMDLWERYERGELDNRDSIHVADSTEYFTVSGRKVYGGGGIMPDVFVPRDTVDYTPWFNLVSNRAYTYRFAYQYVDSHRATLSRYTNWRDLERHLLTAGVVDEFVDYAAKMGVQPNRAQISKSRRLLTRVLNAYIVRDALGDEAFYPLWLRDDPVVKEALKQ